MDEPAVRYVQAPDGARLAYQVFGAGPVLVGTPIVPFSPLQGLAQVPELRAWYAANARSMTLVQFDHRGTGLSDRTDADLSLDARLRDLAAVVDGLGLERFALLGAISGAPAALAYAATHRERVSRLLLWCPQVRTGDLPIPRWFGALARQDWPAFTEVVYRALYGWQEDEPAHRHAAWLRASIDQATFLQNRAALTAIDASWALPQITAPTLVLTRREASFLGPDAARTLTARIAGAQLRVIEGASLAPWQGDGDAVLAATIDFVHGPRTDVAAPQTVAAVPLTMREREVLILLARGRTGREIATELGIGLATVQRHIANLYAKLGVRGRVEAAAYAYACGLVTPAGALST